jgi:purine-nucleoside phosphorylase
VLGHLAGVPVAAFFGRVHFYEGHGMDVPALLPRLAKELGADTIVLTAAVGGLLAGEAAGTIVILRDHLNLMGESPLRGWRHSDGTPTFISTSDVYDAALRDMALERAQALGIASSIGVYAAMSGPAYETPTELAMLQNAGATVVGMSMVPESLPAAALDMRALGLCSLTNAFGEHVEHEEVVRVSNETAATVGKLLVDLMPRL